MRSLFMFLILAVCWLPAGCSTQPHYQHNYSPTTDFSRFKTWMWDDGHPMLVDRLVGEDPVERLVRRTVAAELEARGLKLVQNNPDLLVHYRGNIFRRVADTPGATGYSSQIAWEKNDAGSWLRRSSRVAVLSLFMLDGRTRKTVWTATGREPVEDRRDAMRKLTGVIRTLLGAFPPGR
ncbi:DUF4136 domain-containing protein [Geothermobacter ehrlichii]|nr:DUF4136 domain-containing protein [Geothermobacter ehrlichii]